MKGYFNYIPASRDKKLGGLSATYTSNATCPGTCPFHGHGCYAERGNVNLWRLKINAAAWGVPLDKAAELVASKDKTPTFVPCRLNVLGDVCKNSRIDWAQVLEYKRIFRLRSNTFGYTHGPVLTEDVQMFRQVNSARFCLNRSCENPREAVDLFKKGVPTVLAVNTFTMPHHWGTYDDVPMVQCPYQTRGLTCAQCKLCMQANRKCVVVFEDDTNKTKNPRKFKPFLVNDLADEMDENVIPF